MVQKYAVGLNNVGSYQVSGKPFATGSINCKADALAIAQVDFPNVTSWVMISNHDSANANVRVGFSSASVAGLAAVSDAENSFLLISPTSGSGPVRLDLKLTQLFLSGSDNVSVAAGLTFIDAGSINNGSISPSGGNNWSGSAGV